MEGKYTCINDVADLCKSIAESKGFYLKDHISQLLLIGSEVAEALELLEIQEIHPKLGEIMDKFYGNMVFLEDFRHKEKPYEQAKITDFDAFAEELADIVIRVFSYARALDIDIEFAIQEKILKNEKRPIRHNKQF